MNRGRTDVEEVNEVVDAEQVSIRCGAGKLGRQLGVFVSWYDEGWVRAEARGTQRQVSAATGPLRLRLPCLAAQPTPP